MQYEDLLVAFCCFLFSFVARSKVSPAGWHGVRGPLSFRWGEECAAQENSVCKLLCEGRQQNLQGGRATRTESKQKSREFDATRGYPGEDILHLLQGQNNY